MPISSGYGGWPAEHGVESQPERLNQMCAICTQKRCFKCEHQTPVKNSIFQHEPYILPKDKQTVVENGQVSSQNKNQSVDENNNSPRKKNNKKVEPANTQKQAQKGSPTKNANNKNSNNKKGGDNKAGDNANNDANDNNNNNKKGGGCCTIS